MNNSLTRVMITAIGGGSHGEQILKALRMSNNNYWILGTDAQKNCYNFNKTDKSSVLPLANENNYVDKLFDLIKKNNIQVLFHGCEPELKIFSKYRKQIEELGVFLPINDKQVIDLCMDKFKTNKKLLDLGFKCPQYQIIKNKNDIKNISWFPAVIKPYINGGGSANVYIVQNPKELQALSQFIDLNDNSVSFFAQEYIGHFDQEYTVGVLSDMNGNCINSIAMKRELKSALSIRYKVRNRTKKSNLGKFLIISSGVSQGQIDTFKEINDQCRLIAKEIGAKGPLNIQCRFDKNNVYVFEINPRFSGTTSIRAMLGFNEPDILIQKKLFNIKMKRNFSYSKGFIARSISEVRV